MCAILFALIGLAITSNGHQVVTVPGGTTSSQIPAQSQQRQSNRKSLPEFDPLKALALQLLASNPAAAWQIAGAGKTLRNSVVKPSKSVGRRMTPCRACEDEGLPSDAEDACDITLADNRDALEAKLMRMAATTNRGAAISTDDSQRMSELLRKLECLGPPDVSAGALDGTWRLAYATCPAYRSSPFFWAYGQAAEGPFKEQLLSITDGLPFYRVGVARQTLSGTADAGTLVSSIELILYVFDALLPPLRGMVTTTANTRPDAADLSSLILDVQTTEVKESVLPFTENIVFPTQQVLDSINAGSATVELSTSYLSEVMRISRSPDGDLFVYVRE